MLKQSPDKDFNYFSDKIIEWYTKPNVFRKAPEGILKA
jgi:hypothetical protein